MKVHYQEGAEVLLCDVDLSVVDEAEDGLEVRLSNSLQVNQRVVVWQSSQQVTEK